MQLKSGVKILGMKPEIVLAIMVCESVYKKHGVEMVITSITDSKHSAVNSDHYKGYAFDLRVSNIPSGDKGTILGEIQNSLTKDFQVIDEGDHFHIGYKPIF